MVRARIQEVIIVESTRGLGKNEADPVRRVISIFSKDGKLIADLDPFNMTEVEKEIHDKAIPSIEEFWYKSFLDQVPSAKGFTPFK